MKYWNISGIKKKNCDINIIIGERSNGKSFQLKNYVLHNYLESGNRFILLRRFENEITTTFVSSYFKDIDIKLLTNGLYDSVTLYRKCIYFSFTDENFKLKLGEKIGYAFSLSNEQRFAGFSLLDVTDIVFEEFMTRTIYLKNETEKLLNLYCTVDRKRCATKIWLVGNSITKINPYFENWGLFEKIKTLNQGEIFVEKKYISENDVVKIAVEYCKSSGRSSHVFGDSAEMMSSGKWQVSKQPKLEGKYKDYELIFRIVFKFKNFKYIGECLLNLKNYGIVWFIYPKYSEIKKNTFVITDEISSNPYYFNSIYDIKLNQYLIDIFDTFKESKIFYSSDETGTDFKHLLNFNLKR